MISSTGGLYFLEVMLYGYRNPTGTCEDCVIGQTHGCCDRHNTTECSNFLCDTYFDYCLRPLGSKEEGAGGCSYSGYIVTPTFNRNDGFINFSQSTVLGLDNPLILPGLTNDWNVSLTNNLITIMSPRCIICMTCNASTYTGIII